MKRIISRKPKADPFFPIAVLGTLGVLATIIICLWVDGINEEAKSAKMEAMSAKIQATLVLDHLLGVRGDLNRSNVCPAQLDSRLRRIEYALGTDRR